MDDRELIRRAFEARKKAYAPYSHFMVGAALVTAGGTVYSGCNIENASYGAAMCAERTAFFAAAAAGERDFAAIVIAGGAEDEVMPLSGYAYPCGMCRQVMAEFAGPEFRILVARSQDDVREFTLGELLPESFSL